MLPRTKQRNAPRRLSLPPIRCSRRLIAINLIKACREIANFRFKRRVIRDRMQFSFLLFLLFPFRQRSLPLHTEAELFSVPDTHVRFPYSSHLSLRSQCGTDCGRANNAARILNKPNCHVTFARTTGCVRFAHASLSDSYLSSAETVSNSLSSSRTRIIVVSRVAVLR